MYAFWLMLLSVWATLIGNSIISVVY